MADLHPAQRSGIVLLPSNRPLALLTRHSVRESGNGIPSYDLPLTPEGVALAERWGRELTMPLHGLYSSPVERCVDTALAMARGAGTSLEVRPATTLVEPGCFVHSLIEAGPLFLTLGPLAFINRHLQEPLAGLLSPKAGTAKLIRHIQDNLGPPGSLTVHVTHDTILAAFIYHLLARDEIDETDWPWMMEGAWLWFDDEDVLRWVWRGEPGGCDVRAYREQL